MALKKYTDFSKEINESMADDSPAIDAAAKSADIGLEPNERAVKMLKKAFMHITGNYGFFWDLLSKINIKQARPEEEKQIKTMATDGKNIIFNLEFLNGLWNPNDKAKAADRIIWVLCHEIMHCALFHFTRQGTRNNKLWNHAGDYAINLMLSPIDGEDTVGKMPIDIKNSKGEVIFKKPLHDAKYENMSTEEIYDDLVKNAKTPPPGGGEGSSECPHCGEDLDGVDVKWNADETAIVCPFCGEEIPVGEGKGGSGKGGPNIPPRKKKGKGGKGGKPESSKEGEGDLTEEDMIAGDDVHATGDLDNMGIPIFERWSGGGGTNDDEVKDEWFNNRTTAAQRFQGVGGAALRRWIKKLTEPEVDWRTELKRFVAQCYAKVGYKFYDPRLTVTRGYPSGPSTTKKQQDFDNAVICVDTSGSITDQDLAVFAAEMNGIIKARALKTLRIIWCDADICGVQVFGQAAKKYPKEEHSGPVKDFHMRLRSCGGSGTSFVPPFIWMNQYLFKNKITPAFIVYFTDAQGDAPTVKEVMGYEERIMWIVHPSEMNCMTLGANPKYIDRDAKGKAITEPTYKQTGKRKWKIVKVNGLKPKKK